MFDFIRKKAGAEDHHNSAVSSFNKVINFCLFALVLLTPLLFLPLTTETKEFNKQALLLLAVVVMLGAWIIKILSTRKISWTKTSLDYILLAYLGVYLITSFASIDKVSSFLGYYGRFTGSFVSVLSFIVLYFLTVNNVRSEKTVKRLMGFLTWGMGITLVYSLMQLLGWFVLPFAFTHDRGFNPVGSLVGLSIFAAISLIFFLWLQASANRSKPAKMIVGFLCLVCIAILFLINAFIAWLILALGLIAFLALGMAFTQEASSAGFWKPMLVLVVAVLFVAFQFLPQVLNPRNLVNINLPVEIQLSNQTTWTLAKNSLGQAPKNAILGSGPGTTGIAFGGIKPTDLNKTIVWSLNFDRASSEISSLAIETGLLGLLAFELTCILFLLYGLFFLLKKSSHSGRTWAMGFFMLWLSLYITHFFYFFNTTFYLMFWLSLAVFMAIANWSEQEAEDRGWSFASSPRSALSWMFASLIVLAVILVGTFFEAAVYGGEVAYAAGVAELNLAKPDFARVASDFSRAITLNPYRDVYYLAYGQNLIFLASEEAAKPKPNIQQIQTWMADTITAGRSATAISPKKAANWSALAQFYTGIRPLVSGTDKFIVDSWQQAIARDPKNPSLYAQLASAQSAASETIDPAIAGTGKDTDDDGLSDDMETKFSSEVKNPDTNNNGVSDGDEVKAGFDPLGAGRLTPSQLAPFMKVDQGMLKSAEEALNKAIELKPDLPDSYIALARVLEKGNKQEQARKQLDEAAKQFPSNADILFEQGRITYNQQDYTGAEKIFNQVVALAPGHANALYSLGLIYQQRGDTAGALTMFEKVREITGPNVELEKLINSLKSTPQK